MSSQSTKELVEELNKHRVEVSKLRNALDELEKEKESWFKKKNEFSKSIRESIQKIKNNKINRDSFTHQVRELKLRRDNINKELSLKSAELEKLRKERLEHSKSLDIKESPSRIKQQMEKLEFKIETDTVSFEKEKELMKWIKELKKDYDKVSILQDSNIKIREILDITMQMKEEAYEVHKSIQEKAGQSQVLHEEILKLSAEIDKLKLDEEDAFKKFLELKKKFNEVNTQLKEKLNEMKRIKLQLDKIYSDKKEKRKQQEESFLKSKEEEVNQKIKRREKLTTEDLLVFQKFGRE